MPPKRGKKSGLESHRASAGDTYEGEYSKNNKREGHGTCRFADGTIYEGTWKGGFMDGMGIYRMADGDVYEGCWKHGAKEGPGTYYYASGRADVCAYTAGSELGEGVRWSEDRQLAWRLQKGDLVEEISLEEAAQIAKQVGSMPVPPIPEDRLKVTYSNPECSPEHA